MGGVMTCPLSCMSACGEHQLLFYMAFFQSAYQEEGHAFLYNKLAVLL